jgi:hypothetical protein
VDAQSAWQPRILLYQKKLMGESRTVASHGHITFSWRISKLRGRQSQSTTPHPDRRFGEGAPSLLGKGPLQEAKSFQVLKSYTNRSSLANIAGDSTDRLGWRKRQLAVAFAHLKVRPPSRLRSPGDPRTRQPLHVLRDAIDFIHSPAIIVITVINGETLEIFVKPRAGDSLAYPILSGIAFCTPISGSNDGLLLHPGCEVPRRIQVKSSMLLRTRGQIALQNFSLTRTIGSFDGNIDEFSLHSREQAASRDFRDVGLARRHWENESLPVARLIAAPLSQDDGVIPRSDGRTRVFGCCRETSTACSPALALIAAKFQAPVACP